jgi:hypothetical protein
MSERTDLKRLVRQGDRLFGYCNGFFGRESYADKTVQQVGDNWILALEDDAYGPGNPVLAHFDDSWIETGQLTLMLRCWRYHEQLSCVQTPESACQQQVSRREIIDGIVQEMRAAAASQEDNDLMGNGGGCAVGPDELNQWAEVLERLPA